jgi:RNA polymerase sigma factor (sigma-70 family)
MSKTPEPFVDEVLVLGCQAGDVAALEALVSRWQRRFWCHAYRLTGDPEAAWDVTQESWLGILRGLARLDDPGCFASWAFRIVTNKARDWVHRRQKRKPAGGIDVERLSASDEALRCETSLDLGSVLRRLPPDQGAILSLYYLEGLGIADVSRVLGIPEGTVKSRLHAARAAFKVLWQSSAHS